MNRIFHLSLLAWFVMSPAVHGQQAAAHPQDPTRPHRVVMLGRGLTGSTSKGSSFVRQRDDCTDVRPVFPTGPAIVGGQASPPRNDQSEPAPIDELFFLNSGLSRIALARAPPLNPSC